MALRNADTAMCVAKANNSKEDLPTIFYWLYIMKLKKLILFIKSCDFILKKILGSTFIFVRNFAAKSNQLSAWRPHDQRLLDKESEYIALYH